MTPAKGIFEFDTRRALEESQPGAWRFPVARLQSQPYSDFDRRYRNGQWATYAQDTVRLREGLSVNFGIRSEYFGSPRLAQGEDLVLNGSGLSDLRWRSTPDTLWDASGPGLALRGGLSWRLQKTVVLRLSYGRQFDRPFDNLWRTLANNSWYEARAQRFTPGERRTTLPIVDYSLSAREIFGRLPDGVRLDTIAAPRSVWIQNRLPTPVVDSAFAGLELRPMRTVTAELSGMFAGTRRLLEGDLMNRPSRISSEARERGDLGPVTYRSGAGRATWVGGSAAIRYQPRRGFVAANYTWSHAIDRQSDALGGDFFDLALLVQGQDPDGDRRSPAFVREGGATADRGNSSFDQRHRLAAYGLYNLPAPPFRLWRRMLVDWTVSGTFLWRSGPVFSVYGADIGSEPGFGSLINNRADVVLPNAIWLPGKAGLNPAAFRPTSNDGSDRLGNLGRNALRGPSHLNHDFSLQKSLALKTEHVKLTVRAEAYNLLNRANATLSKEGDTISAADNRLFGRLEFGASPDRAGVPSVAPFRPQARQVQILLRLEF